MLFLRLLRSVRRDTTPHPHPSTHWQTTAHKHKQAHPALLCMRLRNIVDTPGNPFHMQGEFFFTLSHQWPGQEKRRDAPAEGLASTYSELGFNLELVGPSVGDGMEVIQMPYDVAGAVCHCRVALAAAEAGKARRGLLCIGNWDPVLDRKDSYL